MTHPAFTTSFENREMFGWPTQPADRVITAVDVTNVEDEAMDSIAHLADTYLEEAQEHQRHMTEFDAWCAAAALLESVMRTKFGAAK